MLWFDHGRLESRRAGRRAFLFALAAATLSACTVQPLYGPTPGGGQLQASLRQVTIDPVDDRIAQVVRNKLVFLTTGGGAAAEPVYRMKLTVSSREVALGINTIDSSPVFSMNVTASYEVVRIDNGTSVAKGTSYGTASYNRVNQAFANTRAKLDAENRAAETAANDIAIRVAAAMAKGV